ncbi:MAG: lysoplasmalogenase [Acidimicrobiales bacterium]|nr:lysoplasmalogenase [Acidimicrobiales bacterium]
MRKDEKLQYVFKPLVPLTLILMLAVSSSANGITSERRYWIIAALIFALFGDVFLMLPFDGFIFGLASFAICHILIISGLLLTSNAKNSHIKFEYLILFLVAYLIIGAAPLYGIVKGLFKNKLQKLLVPVFIYSLLLTFMASTLLASQVSGHFLYLAGIGGAFFVASDMILAFNKFAKPIRNGDLLVHVTYHVAIASIATAFVWIPCN